LKALKIIAMNSILLLSFVIIYFFVLLVVSYLTSRNSTNHTFFIGNKNSHWALVAFGMIGTSLSGVTFISVPGTVGSSNFAYFQVVIGYFIGYFVVAYVLLPLYYRLNLTSIYDYLLQRFGVLSYKTGALFFIISRTLGATLRLYLVINVLQIFILDALGISFHFTAIIILVMILLYTMKGGVKTIVWTDTLQTFFMLLALVVCVFYIMNNLGFNLGSTLKHLNESGQIAIFNYDFWDKKYFLKQIIGGAFITIAMTGLDQEMMQKNISVKTLGGAQKNMVLFSSVMVLVNFLFLMLGGVLFLFAKSNGLNLKGDDIFPSIAMFNMPPFISIIFIIGLISALFPSADGAITALTSSFCIDILGMQRNQKMSDAEKSNLRMLIHVGFAIVFLLMVYYFKYLDNKSIITILLDIAGYTYGPLLGLFAFGILTKHQINDKIGPIICLLAPILCYFYQSQIQVHFGWKYQVGIEMLVINGLLTFIGLWFIRRKPSI
jgi:Na+/proline symporter